VAEHPCSTVLAALLRIGWAVKRQSGSHRTLSRTGWADFVFAFHEDEEIGPRMLARIAKRTGLRPDAHRERWADKDVRPSGEGLADRASRPHHGPDHAELFE